MRVFQWRTRLLTLFMLHLDLSEGKTNQSQAKDSQITFSNRNPQNQNLDNYKNLTYYPPLSSSNIKKAKDQKVIDNLVKLYGKKKLKGQDVFTNERSEEMEDYIGKYIKKFDSSEENGKNLAQTTVKVNETTDKSEVNQDLQHFVSLIFTNIFNATISKLFSILESSL